MDNVEDSCLDGLDKGRLPTSSSEGGMGDKGGGRLSTREIKLDGGDDRPCQRNSHSFLFEPDRSPLGLESLLMPSSERGRGIKEASVFGVHGARASYVRLLELAI